jgi:hypothetical protein
MKRSAVCIVLIATVSMTSQINTSQAQEKSLVTVVQRPTVIQKGQGRVNVLKVQKPKLFSGNPRKATILADDWDYGTIEVDDIITSYRREDLGKLEYTDQLPDNIRWRLFLARQLAMLKYKEVHG